MTDQTAPASLARIQDALNLMKAGQRDQAAQVVAALVSDNPPLGSTWGPVSRLALGLGETSLALTAAERHAALDRRDLSARLNHGAMLAQHGQGAQALAVAEAIRTDHPSQPAAWHFCASCKAALGDSTGAISDFRQAIALSADPIQAAPSWLAIVEARTITAADDADLIALNALRKTLPTSTAASEAKAAVLFAIGKAEDDLDHPDAAFEAYSEGSRLVAAARPDGLDKADALVDQVVSGFTADRMARLPASDIQSKRPIFVLGLPRSGTTLVEQILVSHRDVIDGAELNLFRAAAMPVGGFSPQAIETFAAARPGGFGEVGRAYLHMLEARYGPYGRVIDKTLNHSRYLGLIHQVLPQARFIWMRRDPGAVAWSSFRTWFAQGVNWSWSLESIARYFRSEDRLHAHWTQVMGDAILTVPYEELVSDPKPWINRILAHVELPYEAAVEDFHKTDRAVTTASFAQVKRPIYTTSTSAWRRYEPHIKAFFDAYRAP